MRKLWRETICILLVVALLVTGVVTAMAASRSKTYAYLTDRSVYFYDVSGSYAWAHKEVDALALGGVIANTDEHLYYPEVEITRGDFIIMLDRAFKMNNALMNGLVQPKGSFYDVDEGEPYSRSIRAAKALGVATGTADGLFLPEDRISRQDAMVFLKRAIDLTDKKLTGGTISAFSDRNDISTYARSAVGALAGAGIVSGSNGKINPRSYVKRAEIAVMIYRSMHLKEFPDGIRYEKRNDIVNVCIGSEVYTDVVIENYDPERYYGELMQYSLLRQKKGVTYITLEENQKIDQNVTITNGRAIFHNGSLAQNNETYPIADNCVAIAVSPYHTISYPISTGSVYQYCMPTIVNGEVSVIYYQDE